MRILIFLAFHTINLLLDFLIFLRIYLFFISYSNAKRISSYGVKKGN